MTDEASSDQGGQEAPEPPGTSAEQRAAMFDALIAAGRLSTMEQLPGLVTEHAASTGLTGVVIYLADLQQVLLSPLSPYEAPVEGRRPRPPQGLSVEGTVAGRAFQQGKVLPAFPRNRDHWWVPLVDGTERLGVLRLTRPGASDATLREMQSLAGLVAMMIVSKRGASASYDRLVRRRRMNVAAEMEWRLMPPRTFASGNVVVSGVMEPAYEVSGDVFDYAFDGLVLHLALLDAMGHDVAAGLTANLALATARNTRRYGADLPTTASAIEQALLEQWHHDRFITGILAQLDVSTGALQWLSRGHHPPIVLRSRTIVTLNCTPSPPMGTGLGGEDTVCHAQLQPGDRILLYSDGIIEARDPRGEEYGLIRLTRSLTRHQVDELPVPETLRRLIRHHIAYHHGRLHDDATVLLLEWHGSTAYADGQAEALVGLPRNKTNP